MIPIRSSSLWTTTSLLRDEWRHLQWDMTSSVQRTLTSTRKTPFWSTRDFESGLLPGSTRDSTRDPVWPWGEFNAFRESSIEVRLNIILFGNTYYNLLFINLRFSGQREMPSHELDVGSRWHQGRGPNRSADSRKGPRPADSGEAKRQAVLGWRETVETPWRFR